MKERNTKNTHSGKATTQQRPVFKALLEAPTRENSSGFAFSFAALFIFGLIFLVSIVLGMTGFDAKKDADKDWYLYLSYSIAPVALLLASLWYMNRMKIEVKPTVKKHNCHPKYYLIAIVLQIGLFSLSFLNTLFAGLLEKLGYTLLQSHLPSLDGFGVVGVILVVALMPALFEEILFRGVVLDGMRSFGTAGAALLCGGLFAIYHQNPEQTIYQFCCGAAFALMAIRAGSVFPTMLAHFVNNATIILLQKFLMKETELDIPMPVLIPIIVVSGLCLLGSLAYLIFVDKNNLPEDKERADGEKSKLQRSVFILAVMIGVLVCFVGWSSTLYSGFFGSTGA